MAPGLLISLLLVFMGALRLVRKKPASAVVSASQEDPATQSLANYVTGLRQLFRNRSLLVLSTSGVFRSMTQNALLSIEVKMQPP